MTTDHRPWHRRLRPRRWNSVQAAPLLLTLVIGALAASTPKNFAVSRLLPAAPALAASMWSVAATIGLGAVTVVLVIAIELILKQQAPVFTLGAIAAVTAAAAYASHVRLQRERTLSQVRSVADAAQAVVLHPLPHSLPNIRIESLYLAAAEEARIGGDFFEVIETRHGVRMLIGDVRGKGLSAVGVASAIMHSFREAAYDEPDLERLARRLDTSLARYSDTLPSPDAGERFATAVLAEIPHQGGSAVFVNCGHPPPLLLCATGDVRSVDPTEPSPPINMARLIGAEYTMDTVPLSPGDQLLLYTDGVTETRNRAGVFFPLLQWARQQGPMPSRTLLDLLHQRLLRYSGAGLDDDIAVLLVRYDGPPSGR
ncbi:MULTISPECIES: PP2C family protein-serine/threonine phosphatase [unclassified Streptomyces]|uniref:PP2C family protein-serine/threonine phosphatase n=1 Tax=unclassified Streptomyces TaxID=2593676 RepID=UPI002E2C28A6|nr:PP2C family protein-serine/threonine phosphatase [Streptomyces sp. NBC_00223]